ncbi:MAG TPA: efflux RND transporter periplasmic adaptor subunit [Anaerolineales bacterium]|nr:efflux RND transporter periplasmic adaptor subunit [Anaerolineales bacterium]
MKRNAKRSLNKWPILFLIGLAVLLGSTIFAYLKMQTSEEETVLETSTIGTGDIILSATGLGNLANEEVSFGFKNNGQVSEVLVSLGDKVEAGQVLARLESQRLELKYKQAEANYAALTSPSEIAAAKQSIAEAQQSFDTARDDLQFLIGPEMLVGEEAVAQAEQDLQLAKAAAENDPSDANQQKINEAEAALAKARETLSYAYYNYSDSYTKQTFTYPIRNDKGTTIRRDLIAPTDAELLAGRAAYALAKANLSDAQNYLDVLLGNKTVDEVPASSVTSITAAKNALDSASAELAATELVAPVSGTVTSLNLSVGENVGTAAVVTLSNIAQPYTFDVYLDETDWDTAKVGYAASVTFDLLPDETYTGKVTRVYPGLDDSTGTNMVHVVVQLDHSVSVDLPAGSTASVDVTGGEALGAVLVPTSALKEVESEKYIVYIIKNGEPVEQAVEIGLQDILYAEVKSGLEAGDVVLTDATALDQ